MIWQIIVQYQRYHHLHLLALLHHINPRRNLRNSLITMRSTLLSCTKLNPHLFNKNHLFLDQGR